MALAQVEGGDVDTKLEDIRRGLRVERRPKVRDLVGGKFGLLPIVWVGLSTTYWTCTERTSTANGAAMLRHSFARHRYRSVIISCLVSARKSHLRPVFVALSVLVGVASAASGLLVSRNSGDEHLQVALTDTNYQPSTVPHSPPASSTTTIAPTTTSASLEPSTPSSPPSSDSPKPPPSTSSKAPAPVVAPDSSLAAQVLALVNQQRANVGCGALTADGRLDTAAQKFSEDMSARDYFSHTTPEGVTFAQRIKAAGYPSPAAENIAKGSTTAAKTMDMWMNSDGHRRNILNCSYRKLGVGLDKSGWYWVQDFGF